MASFTALFDACVLYPAPLRDLLVQLATTSLFRAKWTNQIHDEWIRNVLRNNGHITPQQLERTRHLMNTCVMDCLVEGYEYLIETVDLPDPDDRHVVAAAFAARADAIITTNLRDFPARALKRFNVEAIHPDDFIGYQFDIDAAKVIVSAAACRARLANPARSAAEYIATLESLSLTKTADALRKFESVL